MWSLIGANDGPFVINSTSGVISLAPDKTLDFETSQTTDLTVEVRGDTYGVMASVLLDVPIVVTNVLESITVTDSDDSSNQIPENVPAGTIVSGIALQVTDEGGNDVTPDVVWSLTDSADGLFMIDPSSGVISLVSETLDFETNALYNLRVRASVSEISDTVSLQINVINTVEIRIESSSGRGLIPESATPGTQVSGITFEVRDESDTLLTDDIVWSLADSSSPFSINPATGMIALSPSGTLDYELITRYTLMIQISTVLGGVTLTARGLALIDVENVLEDITVSDGDSAENVIPESALGGTAVSGIRLRVRDEGDRRLGSDNVTWSLTDSVFDIGSTSGVISLAPTATLDFETQPSYQLSVEAMAIVSGVTLTDQIELTVNVENVFESVMLSDTDGNDNMIAENALPNTQVSGISLTLRDERNELFSGGIVYSFS